MAKDITAFETPAQYLETHCLTRELQRLGVTEEQRQAMRFRGTNKGLPFDRWSFTFLGTTPILAISLVRAYAALKWLILENPSYSRDKEDAWRLVAETMAAPTLAIGERARDAQSKKAKKPRGRITDDGRTMDQVIARLALTQYPRESARAIWTHLGAVLEEEGLSPAEIVDTEDPQKWTYEYDFNDQRKRISFRRFQAVLSKARREKKSR